MKCGEDVQRAMAKILTLAYKTLPENPIDAMGALLWFYSCGAYKSSGGSAIADKKQRQSAYSLSEDFMYIWAAFMSEFGIDLTVKHLHWWHFQALIGCLGDDCRFSRIIGYRSMDLSQVKDSEMRSFYSRMQKEYRLEGTADEKEAETVAAIGSAMGF